MPNNAKNFYNTFSAYYPIVDFFLQPQKKILAEKLNQQVPGQLLEVGVGNGSHLKYYRNHQITGIDISSAMLARAKSMITGRTLVEMDGENLTFNGERFDYVVMSHVIAVAANPEKLLSEAHSVLKPGGKLFILNHFTPDNWMKYFDRLANLLSGIFHLKSVFKEEALSLSKFSKVEELTLGKFRYFKLLIYQKS